MNAACTTVMGSFKHTLTVRCACGYQGDDLGVDEIGLVCICIGCGKRSLITAIDGPDGLRVTIKAIDHRMPET